MKHRTALRRAHGRIHELETKLFAEQRELIRAQQAHDLFRALIAQQAAQREAQTPLWRIAGRRLAAWLGAKCR